MAETSGIFCVSRRAVLEGSVATAAMLAASSVFAPTVHAARAFKIGYVSPQTGPLAAFGEADNFVVSNFLDAVKGGVKVGGATLPVEVVVKDSQSNPNRAAEVAKELIVSNKIDLMLVASTPETTNPVSTQCEIEEVPCISTLAPWQPYFIGRQANPGGGPAAWKPFTYTYHFFRGLEDIIAVFTNMWDQVPTDKSVGGLFPNDGDGNAWADAHVGLPPALDLRGYKVVDPRSLSKLVG
jgi:branched-chain amino acid transport system substrate-binding protein